MMMELFENRSPLNLPLASTSLVSCLQSFSKSKFRANGCFGIFEQTFNLKVRLLRQQKLVQKGLFGETWTDLYQHSSVRKTSYSRSILWQIYRDTISYFLPPLTRRQPLYFVQRKVHQGQIPVGNPSIWSTSSSGHHDPASKQASSSSSCLINLQACVLYHPLLLIINS